MERNVTRIVRHRGQFLLTNGEVNGSDADEPTFDGLVVAAEVGSRRIGAMLGDRVNAYPVKRLELRLGIVLLARTEAGEKLLLTLEPALQAIDAKLGELVRARDQISSTLRITATRQAYEAVIRPVLDTFCKAHSDALVEVVIDYGFRDIVADRFDAGIRLGEKLQKDMVALRVGPALRMAVVASPAYLARHPAPRTPEDLTTHRCINYRMVSADTVYAWEFERDGQPLKIAVSGPLTFNKPDLMLHAAADGLGVAMFWNTRRQTGLHLAGWSGYWTTGRHPFRAFIFIARPASRFLRCWQHS